MKIHTGDLVLIISGKDKGKQGTVLRVFSDTNELIVEGANIRTRHIRKTQQGPGQRIQYEASLNASKVMIVDPKTKKPTRIGYKVDPKTGSKKRIAKASGEVITKATVKAATKGKKKETTDATIEKPATTTPAGVPVKQPFWKRSGSKNDDGSVKEGGTKDGGAAALPSAHRSQGG